MKLRNDLIKLNLMQFKKRHQCLVLVMVKYLNSFRVLCPVLTEFRVKAFKGKEFFCMTNNAVIRRGKVITTVQPEELKIWELI